MMPVPPVEKSLTWDPASEAVAQAVVQHIPDATPAEAYYHLVVDHIAHVLWRLGAADRALRAWNTILAETVDDVRDRLHEASATTNPHTNG